MAGKKSLGFAAVKRLRERFGISADVFDDTIGAEGRKSEA
jgi:antitoxin component HigA of HigAB toxin-antitoxin module